MAYPSGHITLTVVVWGMVVVVAGVALWSVITSVTVVLLAMIGQAITHHYFTDTVGGVTARHRARLRRGADRPTEIDRCQPNAICVTGDG